MSTNVNLILISDSSGETVLAVSGAVMAQFEGLVAHKYIWPMIRTKSQIDKILGSLQNKTGIVLYTIVNKELRRYLKDECKKLNIPCISAIAHVITQFATYFQVPAERNIPGWQHSELDSSYFSKINAINFTMHHDDGQHMEDIQSSDIILLGVSRTSKTPTSFYLAQRGYKVANIPLVSGTKLPISLDDLKAKACFGLVINPEKLLQIRSNRLSHLGKQLTTGTNDYIDFDQIMNELQESKKLFSQLGIPIVDVTNKAVEEVAAEIISIYLEKTGRYV